MLDGCNLCLKLEVPGLIKSMDLLVSIFANFIDFAGPLLVFISNFLFEVFDGKEEVIGCRFGFRKIEIKTCFL